MAKGGGPKVMQDAAHTYKRIGDGQTAGTSATARFSTDGYKKPDAKPSTFNDAWNSMRRPFGRKLK